MLKGRSSGLLLPIFSLPGGYGTGTLGAGARQFIDFLAQARQHTWQILPLVPPGSGDSPYMSPSAFAGSPWLLVYRNSVRNRPQPSAKAAPASSCSVAAATLRCTSTLWPSKVTGSLSR